MQAIAQVASQLGNTPTVCRKCYVHPAVLETYLGSLPHKNAEWRLERDIRRERRAIAFHTAALRREEKELVNLLKQRALLRKAA